MAARLDLTWKESGSWATGSCPPNPVYIAEIGKDRDGNKWFCKCERDMHRNLFRVDFGKEDNADPLSDPFLSPDWVIDSANYWKAHDEYFHSTYCQYEDTQFAIERFCIDLKLDTKRVDGKRVNG